MNAASGGATACSGNEDVIWTWSNFRETRVSATWHGKLPGAASFWVTGHVLFNSECFLE